MSFIEILKVIVFGIVEGFTEWLPISSTGHLILVKEIIPLDVSKEFWSVFLVVIQLGAILAVVVLFFKKLNPFDRDKTPGQTRATVRLWEKIIVACVPAGLLGLFLEKHMDKFEVWYVVAPMLILYGIFFILIERANADMEFPIERVYQISFKTAAIIGCFQMLSLIPGTSRSGATILGAMLIGCSRGAAAEFSFFLGIPIMFGASFLKLIKAGFAFKTQEVLYLVLGMAVAFVVSIYSIKFLMDYIKQHDFKFFGYYRIILGVIVIAYFAISMMIGV